MIIFMNSEIESALQIIRICICFIYRKIHFYFRIILLCWFNFSQFYLRYKILRSTACGRQAGMRSTRRLMCVLLPVVARPPAHHPHSPKKWWHMSLWFVEEPIHLEHYHFTLYYCKFYDIISRGIYYSIFTVTV